MQAGRPRNTQVHQANIQANDNHRRLARGRGLHARRLAGPLRHSPFPSAQRTAGPLPHRSTTRTRTPCPRPSLHTSTRPRPCTARSTPPHLRAALRGTGLQQAANHLRPPLLLPARPRTSSTWTHGWWQRGGLADGVARRRRAGDVGRGGAHDRRVCGSYYSDRSFATDDYEDDYASIASSRRPRSTRS